MNDGADSYRRFLEGDNAGIREIIETYFDGLALYLNNYVDNLSDAEDLAEETIIELGTKKPRFSGRSSFKTWLYAIGRHRAIDHLRRRTKEVVGIPEDIERQIADTETVEERCMRDEEKKELYRAMRNLKPEYRRVLWLKYFESMSVDEIALVIGRSRHSVYHLSERAVKELRERLEGTRTEQRMRH
ncbi:MAG: sigma-70 family RNA polymerase sigma factor [Lachnospiraceae bacterium]|nr:sigma-70 family RNA polymerase sigma factor [Lachnospiraceae bacterium]